MRGAFGPFVRCVYSRLLNVSISCLKAINVCVSCLCISVIGYSVASLYVVLSESCFTHCWM